MSTLTTASITGATTLTASHANQLLLLTSSADYTVGFDSAATLGSGWWCVLQNNQPNTTAHVITLDPNGAQTIDGAATRVLWPGERVFAWSDGSNINTLVEQPYSAAQLGAVPGGMLGLTSGDPYATSDVASASTVYYTPAVHGYVQLWTSRFWAAVTFTEKSLTLSGLTSGKNYDVFGYLSSGTLAIELSAAWTNDSTRADAVSLQDGRWCKASDKTRLLLGTIRTISTTATCDTLTQRFVSNTYNRQPKRLTKSNNTQHSRNSSVVRYWNNDSTQKVEWVNSIAGLAVGFYGLKANSAGYGGIGWDTSTVSPTAYMANDTTTNVRAGVPASYMASAGYHFAASVQFSYSTGNYWDYDMDVSIAL